MRSFDLFDTLVGRIHCAPESVFSLVEKEASLPGFAFYRMAAFMRSDGTLSDTYRHLQEMLEISREKALKLMEIEFETELKHLFAIVENLEQVGEGDAIISDTYYTEAQVRKILERVGLKKRVELYVSSRGKGSGTVWDTVKARHEIKSHLGDHAHADVAMPLSKGILATHYLGSSLTPAEQAMCAIGQEPLAYLVRSLRLQNPYPPDSPEYGIWNDQATLNVPVLLHSSLYLDAFCREKHKKRVLFTARDCCLWIRLFKALFPEYESIYYFSSRFIYNHPTDSFIEYVRSLHNDETVIVDVHGKGRSCSKFFSKHMNTSPTFLPIVNSGKKHEAVVRTRRTHEMIEQMNYDVIGSVYDVREGKPLHIPLEYDLRFIYPSHACIERCLELLPHYSFHTFDERLVKWATECMEADLSVAQHVEHFTSHHRVQLGDQIQYAHVTEQGECRLLKEE